ncbi:hypothetical protein FIBSPDRAFT_114126 [Athelia psychrophila]|uniref:Uncharacterized protein n=1 Tax=Athelia psychrophila TaxID=1759441 RepID=A0A167UFB1_9AGAM|nr:hypothetical protein FIBSPDRAFT_443649 [Fibularhizoctonia sp. CBS 109695]KZP14345.1 hypothetical protein FIBSPDRAFT_114126 [Fibularhizoctonia sp. CBS 109695]
MVDTGMNCTTVRASSIIPHDRECSLTSRARACSNTYNVPVSSRCTPPNANAQTHTAKARRPSPHSRVLLESFSPPVLSSFLSRRKSTTIRTLPLHAALAPPPPCQGPGQAPISAVESTLLLASRPE